MSIKIDQALDTALLTGGLAIDIVHENGSYSTWGGAAYTSTLGVYEPDANTAWCEAKSFPADKSAHSLADTDEGLGLYQVIVHYPADGGAIAAKTKVEAILALFGVGTVLTYSGQSVEILSNSRDGGRIEGGFYQIVVRANYRAYESR